MILTSRNLAAVTGDSLTSGAGLSEVPILNSSVGCSRPMRSVCLQVTSSNTIFTAFAESHLSSSSTTPVSPTARFLQKHSRCKSTFPPITPASMPLRNSTSSPMIPTVTQSPTPGIPTSDSLATLPAACASTSSTPIPTFYGVFNALQHTCTTVATMLLPNRHTRKTFKLLRGLSVKPNLKVGSLFRGEINS